MKHADAHNKKDNYINMNIQKQFIKYVSQNICGMLGISCYIIVDTFFISQAAGTDGITVLNLVLPVYNLIFAIGSMIGVGSATRYTILKAQEDDSAKKYFANAILWILIISIPFVLSGIFSPDTGSIDLKNHSVSLLSIGVGFEKEMSGRENIILSGMLLGFSEEFIRSKMDEIIEFAGLGKFIDMPVRTYSSGMYSKLAFSITAVLETDIMLIDEVLSVGDEKFKKKSYEKMKSLISNRERTVVIVSHSLDTIADLCDKVMWMHEGKLIEIGTPDEVLPRYLEFMK